MSIFGPEGGGNVIAEEYDSRHEHGLNVRAIGRYIVWYNEAEEKYIYYSVRPRKNIDIDTGKFAEIKNGIKTVEGEEATVDHTRLDTDKDLYVMQINDLVNISGLWDFDSSWSFAISFSMKPPGGFIEVAPFGGFTFTGPGDFLMLHTLGGFMTFSTDQTSNNIKLLFDFNINRAFQSFYRINPSQLNHLSIGCKSNKISLRINGKPWLNDFNTGKNNDLRNIYIGNLISGTVSLGIVSLYDRCLSKPEFIQHFIDYHVPNFTNGEVLI